MAAESLETDGLPEGAYAAGLGEIAAAHTNVSIGSYPSQVDGRFRNQIVVRSKDAAALTAALKAVEDLIARLKLERARAGLAAAEA